MIQLFYNNILAAPGALVSGFAIYSIFSYLFIPFKITLPVAITMVFLIFGLTKYYTVDSNGETAKSIKKNDYYKSKTVNNVEGNRNSKVKSKGKSKNINSTNDFSCRHHIPLTSILFVVGYIIALAIVAVDSFFSETLSSPNVEVSKLFINWHQQFNPVDIVKLGAAIALSFFLPGYALVSSVHLNEEKFEAMSRSCNSDESSIRKRRGGDSDSDTVSEIKTQTHPKKSLLKVLLGYIFSMFITGLVGHVVASFGIPVSGINIIVPLFVIYLIILIVFTLRTRIVLLPTSLLSRKSFIFNLNLSPVVPSRLLLLLKKSRKNDDDSTSPWAILVFACLFALIILSTYYLYGGIIVGDQWYHHGRALMFIYGTFKDTARSDPKDWSYGPPFLSSLLAVFFTLSHNPSANAYASISFLNIMPVFAFYYFFTRWIQNGWRRAALLASALFVLSAGFGWISVLYNYTMNTDAPTKSENSALEIIHGEAMKSFDIVFPSTFIISAHPEYTTSLIIIVLPLGFTLLGLLKHVVTENRIKYFFIFTAISIAGLFSHDEFYFFVIIASILPIIFRLSGRSIVYISFLLAISIAFFAQTLLFPGKYLLVNYIFGVPLLALSFFFVAFTWALYLATGFRLISRLKQGLSVSIKTTTTTHHSHSIKLALKLGIVVAVAYFYIFTFILWTEIPVKDLLLQTSQAFESVVPWYVYPMKLGLAGLIGLAFVLLCIFKRPQREVFVFGIIAFIAFFAGPYYDEHRFSKYIMVGMVGFASLLVYQIITKIVTANTRPTRRRTKISPFSLSNKVLANDDNTHNNKQGHSRHFKTLICGLVISSVITLSSLSVLLFVGYHASALEIHNFNLALGRRDFPSFSELNLFRIINNNGGISKSFNNISNVAIMPNQYNIHQGLVGKLQGFTTIPLSLLVQTPLALNASTLEGFYDLLNQSNTRYIIVPTNAIIATEDAGIGIQPRGPSNVLQFALKNFQKIYHDKNYILLAVPSTLTPTSSAADVALVYQKGNEAYSGSSPDNNTNGESSRKILLYSNESFDKIDRFKFIKVDKDQKTALLYGNKSQTLWSKSLPSKGESISYLEGTFRIIQENNTNINNDCGLTWDDGIKKYYVRFTKEKLQLSQTPSRGAFLLQDQGTTREKSIWYKLKVVFLPRDIIEVYLDDSLKLQVSEARLLSNNNNSGSGIGADITTGRSNSHVTKVGVRCSGSGNIGQFQALQVGLLQGGHKLPTGGQTYGNNIINYYYKNSIYDNNYNYYYTLNIFALSKRAYDTFADDDFSSFSKRNIILTFDPSDEYKIGRYLEFVKNGGTLVITSTGNNPDGGFSRLLGIRETGNAIKFDKIVTSPLLQNHEEESRLKISGITKDIRFQASPSVKVLSSYVSNNDQTRTPFAIEKDYEVGDRKGRIIFVNAAGYFEAISKSPSQYFASLAAIPHLIGLNAEKNTSGNFSPLDSVTTARYIGNLTISGQTVINSSSFSFFDPSTVGFYDFLTQGASVSSMQQPQKNKIDSDNDTNDNNNGTGLNDNKKQQQQQRQQHLRYINRDLSEDIQIKDFKVSGPYKVIINSSGRVYLPSWSSYYDYISISVPTGFDMALQLLQGSTAEFTARAVEGGGAAGGGNYTRHVRIAADNDSNNLIEFHNIKTKYPEMKSIPILMKSPEIAVDGNATFRLLYKDVRDFVYTYGIKGVPINISGKLFAKIDHVDHYDTSAKRSYTHNYLTYLKWLETYEKNVEGQYQPLNFEIPGDISYSAKQANSQVPWQKAVSSNASILVAISLFIIMIIALWLFWPKIKKEI
jgi:hypothetical protein